MGQRANSGRNASLDEKKERMEGRQQNKPGISTIRGREKAPSTGGTSGKGGRANRKGDNAGGTGVRGMAMQKLGPDSDQIMGSGAKAPGRRKRSRSR